MHYRLDFSLTIYDIPRLFAGSYATNNQSPFRLRSFYFEVTHASD